MSDIIKELRNAAMLENDDGRRHLAGLLSKAADELQIAQNAVKELQIDRANIIRDRDAILSIQAEKS